MLKSSRLLKLIVVWTGGLTLAVVGFLGLMGSAWTQWDYQVLDFIYKKAVEKGHGPQPSPLIAYLAISDDTYDAFGKNMLDRMDLARVNDTLKAFPPEAVAYDILFSRPSNLLSDQKFQESIENLGSVYLPVAFSLSDQPRIFKWKNGVAYQRLKTIAENKLVEKGQGSPYHASHSLVQWDSFAGAAANTGHINALSDSDGIYRHLPLLIRVGPGYVPSLALSMFLDYVRVSLDQVVVDWGNTVTIPATPESFLDQDLEIPIDNRGRVFIPYVQVWGKDFPLMTAHNLIKYAEDENLHGNLADFFESKFILIGDISQGISDLGQTPLEENVPLVILHAALLNGLLTGSLYKKWTTSETSIFLVVMALLIGLFAVPKPLWVLYVSGAGLVVFIMGWTWYQFIQFKLFPAVTTTAGTLAIFTGLIVGLQWAASRERAFIQRAFSKYLSPLLVEGLIESPNLLKSGGEERYMTVFFSDLAGFTSIAEMTTPPELASFMNDYFTDMTGIILNDGGIIHQYSGDSIMASFGTPLSMPDHANRAVLVALKMQRRLEITRKLWQEQGYPALHQRIGINTGQMYFGNLGSQQVFYYSVLGDAVNLGARLESANKFYGTNLMISEFTFQNIDLGRFHTRLLDFIKVKGKKKAVRVYEVFGETSETLDPERVNYYQAYDEALGAYLDQDFAQALEHFARALTLRPEDQASLSMTARIRALDTSNLPKDWDGSVALTSK